MERPTDRTLCELGQLASQLFCDRLDAVVHQNDISVDHPTVVEHYRAAQVTAARDERPPMWPKSFARAGILISALQFHELTLQMPSEIWMAIDRTAWRPRIEYPPVRFVRFSGTTLTDGVKRHRIEGVEVAITDPARTILDCFRYRGKVGLDVALEGLREGLRQRKVTTDQLWRHATKMRVWSILKPYVEATAADAT